MADIKAYAEYVDVSDWWRREDLLEILSTLDSVFIAHQMKKRAEATKKRPPSSPFRKPR